MLTRNYYDFIRCIYEWDTTVSTGTVINNIDLRDNTGSSVSIQYYGSGYPYVLVPGYPGFSGSFRTSLPGRVHTGATSSNLYRYWGLVLGDGDTAPTIDDYCLSGNIISSFSILSTSYKRFTYDNGIATWTISSIIQNTGSDTIVVREVGAFAQIISEYNGSSYYYRDYLIERTVLENPITIEAGNTATINYTVQTVFPTAPDTAAAVASVSEEGDGESTTSEE